MDPEEPDEITKLQEQKIEEIIMPTLISRSLTECASVFFQLVCFSRLGTKDYYYLVNKKGEYDDVLEPSLSMNLVLFVTLVLFQFPFMNAYILLMYDTCVIGRTNWKRIAGCFWLLGCQALGVTFAWLVIKYVGGEWSDSITWMSAEASTASDAGRSIPAEIVEEFCAVTALLVGYVHLTYLNFRKVGLFRSPEHLFSEFSETTKKLAVPMDFILQVTLLVAGLLRAFPTAHLSPHISLYLLIMKYTTWTGCACRVGGGFLAFALSWALFWGYYAGRTGVHAKGAEVKVVSTNGASRVYQAMRSRVLKPLPPVIHDSGGAISFHDAYRHVYRGI
jgi:hypothetical protein